MLHKRTQEGRKPDTPYLPQCSAGMIGPEYLRQTEYVQTVGSHDLQYAHSGFASGTQALPKTPSVRVYDGTTCIIIIHLYYIDRQFHSARPMVRPGPCVTWPYRPREPG